VVAVHVDSRGVERRAYAGQVGRAKSRKLAKRFFLPSDWLICVSCLRIGHSQFSVANQEAPKKFIVDQTYRAY